MNVQRSLLRRLFQLAVFATGSLLLRDLALGTEMATSVIGLGLSLGSLLWSYQEDAPIEGVALVLLVATVGLLTVAALRLGGASAPALSLAFLPCSMAMLVLGPKGGLLVTGVTLVSMAGLAVTSDLSKGYDRLRFADEVTVTFLSVGLSYSLHTTLLACERKLIRGKDAVQRIAEQRRVLTEKMYVELRPLSELLVAAAVQARQGGGKESVFQRLGPLVESLDAAKMLARPDPAEQILGESNLGTRRKAMRLWLRLGAAVVGFFALRNFVVGAPFVPVLFVFTACFPLELLVSRRTTEGNVEWVALLIGLAPLAGVCLLIFEYGPTPEAPVLVTTPCIVMFTALLSQGRATGILFALQMLVLGWVALGEPPSQVQWRLLGNLALSSVVVSGALRYVFVLRRGYADSLLEEGSSLSAGLRSRRRLSGTLFHDASNHLQALTYYLEVDGQAGRFESAVSLARRVHRLVRVSERLLLDAGEGQTPSLAPTDLKCVVESLAEAYRPRLEGKSLTLAVPQQLKESVLAAPDLLTESVLGNLLSNAIKFSPRGSQIVLAVRSSGPQVEVSLSDCGPGIPQKVLDVLEDDSAVPSSRGTAGEQGQGFGLQLVQEHLEHMGGLIEFKRRVGGGTEAIVSLRKA